MTSVLAFCESVRDKKKKNYLNTENQVVSNGDLFLTGDRMKNLDVIQSDRGLSIVVGK
jgi:hypothetical protein